ncbi:CBS domain-containing protein [Desulfuromonas carbonis]|uniref:CBS domain-containing protein n=1 Tax=Desulfuromonas sp. DDH964 TaxID=1823759 RepID=UPI00078D1A6B|nr:CBS domain-containing protein [Desulfuromonas sp. DDH964]AMV71753.1 Hypoxic response protein 1 [Desulfuromonas sp. DDH964]
MKTVRELVKAKGQEVWTVRPDQTVYAALELMAEKEIGALVVVEREQVIGILSERDYARKVVLRGVTSRETKVAEIMSKRVVFVRPEQTVEECLGLMTQKRCRHLPVMKDKKLVGLISIGDAVKEIIAAKEHLISQLENYILSG